MREELPRINTFTIRGLRCEAKELHGNLKMPLPYGNDLGRASFYFTSGKSNSSECQTTKPTHRLDGDFPSRDEGATLILAQAVKHAQEG